MVVKLQIANTSGADLGPFNLTANVGSVVPSTATRAELIAGLDVTVDPFATSITLTSTGDCTNDVTTTIQNIPTTTYCYEIVSVQSTPGECFNCPGFFESTTDTFIRFFDACGGTQIPAPEDINISVTYSDSSTSGSFIPAGKTGDVLIAYSNIQCAPLPSCGEIASPEFTSVNVVTVGGSIVTECCIGGPATTTTTTAAPTTTTTTSAPPSSTTTTTQAPSNISMTLNSDTESIGNVKLTYTRTNGAAGTYQIGDADNTAPTNLSDTVTNALFGSSMTAQVYKYSSGTTLEVGTGAGVPRVQLIVNVNGTDVYDQVLDTGDLTLNYTFTYLNGDEVVITGYLTSV